MKDPVIAYSAVRGPSRQADQDWGRSGSDRVVDSVAGGALLGPDTIVATVQNG